MIALEETRRQGARKTSVGTTSSVLVAAEPDDNPPPPPQRHQQHHSSQRGGRQGTRNQRGGRGRAQRGGRNSPYPGNTSFFPGMGYSPFIGPYSPWQPYWAYPPSPYPIMPPRPVATVPRQAGVLGRAPGYPGPSSAAPQQAFVAPAAADTTPLPTELPQLFNAMTLQPPDDNWYLDTGASTHLMNDPGTLPFISNWRNCTSHIMVGDGTLIPVKGYDTSTLPSPHPSLTLRNIQFAPAIVKNLIYVRRFTTDNNVSVEFDHFGFNVKDLRMGTTLTRCNSFGDLYPLSTPSLPPSALAAISPTTWHNHLGHPGTAILDFLRVHKCIQCNKESLSHLCHAYQLGKHCRLPFSPSNNATFAPFSIIHTDLWTSPIISPSGYRYYLLCLDDYSHYLWVFPLKSKSHVFSTFLSFLAHIKTQFHSTIKTIQCDNGTE